MVPIAIAFGANLGDRASQISHAFDQLSPFCSDLRLSSLHESAPMYLADQPAFLNAVAIGKTSLGPLALFRVLKGIESAMGRSKSVRNGPREIDLDLIAYGVLTYRYEFPDGSTLEIPHPRVLERPFVVEPWLELDPSALLAGHGFLRSAQ